MIKINKTNDPPKILSDNHKVWTENLLDAIKNYCSFSKIPKDEKKSLLKFYSHQDIQDILFECSYGKCAFCECIPSESGYLEVEHFAPKALYPEKTFEWNNFLPVCRLCNGSKMDYDTIINPLINPTHLDPENYFCYDLLNIICSVDAPDTEIAQRTIEKCNLNSPRLLKARANLLCSITEYLNDLNEHIKEINASETERKKHNKIIKLRNSIEIIDNLKEANEKYAGFTRFLLNNNKVYISAKKIIDEYFNQSA